MKYTLIYIFNVVDELQAGNRVYILDRKCKKIYDTNNMAVTQLMAIISSQDTTRFEAWIEEKDRKENEDEQ